MRSIRPRVLLVVVPCAMLMGLHGEAALRPGLQGQPQVNAPRRVVTVKGSKHPELIPTHVTWEFMFRGLLQVVRGNDPTSDFNPEKIDGLSRFDIKMPAEDVVKMLVVGDAALRSADALRRNRTGEADSWQGERDAAEAIMDARDELVRTLPKASFDALKRRAARVALGTTVDVPIE
jgi:hypothetical protein